MTFEQRRDASRGRMFWVRITLTMLVVATPLAWLLVVVGVSVPVIVVASLISSVAVLMIWDGTRWLPKGLVFWARPEPLRDERTGVYNPAGWAKLLEVEESRCVRYELPATVVVVRLEPAGEDTDARAGQVLNKEVRAHDVVGYLGDGVFGVLAINADATASDSLVRRVKQALDSDGVRSVFAVVDRGPTRTLTEAWKDAERVVSGEAGKPVQSSS